MLIEPVEKISYAAILKSLKSSINPGELGLTVRGIRETHLKYLLVEMKYAAKDRGRPDSAFRDVIGERERETVLHFVPLVEVNVMDIIQKLPSTSILLSENSKI